MRVLVGIDGSEKSLQALKYASGFLHPQRDRLTLYYSPPHWKMPGPVNFAPEVVQQSQHLLAESVFSAAKQHLPDSFQGQLTYAEGSNTPVEGILAAAEQQTADLIVVAAKSSKRTLPFFLGGVARGVAYHAHVPVLVVRQHRELRDNEMRVLIACDDSHLWQDTCPSLANFQWPTNTQFTLMHVVEAMDQDQYDTLLAQSRNYLAYANSALHEYQDFVVKQKEHHCTELAARRESLPAPLNQAHIQVVQGHVVEQLIKAVNDLDIDLVVLGTRRMPSWQRLLGSTTASLLTQCRCSLLIGHSHPRP